MNFRIYDARVRSLNRLGPLRRGVCVCVCGELETADFDIAILCTVPNIEGVYNIVDRRLELQKYAKP